MKGGEELESEDDRNVVGGQVELLDVQVVQVLDVLDVVPVEGQAPQVHVLRQALDLPDQVVVQVQVLQVLILEAVLDSRHRVT